MKIGILQKGDSVINVTSDFIAVKRKNGEVDIVPIIMENRRMRIDMENIVTISYGDNFVQTKEDNVVITTF